MTNFTTVQTYHASRLSKWLTVAVLQGVRNGHFLRLVSHHGRAFIDLVMPPWSALSGFLSWHMHTHISNLILNLFIRSLHWPDQIWSQVHLKEYDHGVYPTYSTIGPQIQLFLHVIDFLEDGKEFIIVRQKRSAVSYGRKRSLILFKEKSFICSICSICSIVKGLRHCLLDFPYINDRLIKSISQLFTLLFSVIQFPRSRSPWIGFLVSPAMYPAMFRTLIHISMSWYHNE